MTWEVELRCPIFLWHHGHYRNNGTSVHIFLKHVFLQDHEIVSFFALTALNPMQLWLVGQQFITFESIEQVAR